MALITAPGAFDATSYATLAEALAVVGTLSDVPKRWANGDETVREGFLAQAFTGMNSMRFKGTRTASEEYQAGAFPRTGIYDREGFAIASNVVPRSVKTAQIKLALWFAKKDRTADAAPARLKVGTLEIEGQAAATYPSEVLSLLAPFLESYGNCVKLRRG